MSGRPDELERSAMALLDMLPDSVVLFDIESCAIRYVNEAAIERFGYDRDELLRLTITDLRPGGDDAAGRSPFRTKSGETFVAEVRTRLATIGGRRLMLSAIRDVTRLVAMEEESRARLVEAERHRAAAGPATNARLAEQTAILRSAERLLGIGYWSLEVATDRLEWSSAVFEMYGLPEGTSLSRDDYIAMVHEDDRPKVVGELARFLASDEPVILSEHRIRRPDGSLIHLRGAAEYTDRPSGRFLSGFVQDITAIRAAEGRARQSADLLRLASRMARFGGWRVELDSGRTEWTEGMAAIHETPGTTHLDVQTAIDFYPPDYRDMVKRLFHACAEDGTPFDEVMQIVTAKGRRIWVRALGEAERDSQGRLVAVHGAFQDISELEALRDQSRAIDRRLRNTLESMSDGFFMLDRDWRFTYLNRECEQTFGRDRRELLGRSHFEVFPQSRTSPVTAGYQRAFDSGEPSRFTALSKVLDRWLEVRAYPSDEGLAVYFRDVTPEHERAEQLRLLEAAVAQQQDVLVIAEAGGMEAPDGPKVVYVNPAFERLTGFSPDEIPGLTSRIQQGPKTQREVLDHIAAALAAGRPARVELISYRKDGSDYWQEMDIAPVRDAADGITYWVAVYRDISERKAAEAALRLSEERFRLVTQASNEAIWDWDLASRHIWWNENFTAVFGYPVDEVHHGYKQVHSEDRLRVARSIAKAINGSGSLWQEDFRFMKADGSVARVRNRGFVLRDEQGAALRMVGSMIDLTAEHEAEFRQRHLQKMEAIGQLTGGVAHDFNNLLTVILGNAELLCDALADRPELLPLAAVTVTAADRGAELTSRLLAFARRQSLEPKVCDINRLIVGTDEMLRRTFPEMAYPFRSGSSKCGRSAVDVPYMFWYTREHGQSLEARSPDVADGVRSPFSGRRRVRAPSCRAAMV